MTVFWNPVSGSVRISANNRMPLLEEGSLVAYLVVNNNRLPPRSLINKTEKQKLWKRKGNGIKKGNGNGNGSRNREVGVRNRSESEQSSETGELDSDSKLGTHRQPTLAFQNWNIVLEYLFIFLKIVHDYIFSLI